MGVDAERVFVARVISIERAFVERAFGTDPLSHPLGIITTMAAIIEPRPSELRGPRRPAVRLVATDGRSTTVALPLDLGLRTVHLVAALVALAAVLVGTWAISSGALAALAPAPPSVGASAAAPASTTVVTAEAGDSLWTIARRLQPAGDVRPLVDELVALNGTGPLQPGDQIVVPG